MDIKIDPEFKGLIPTLRHEELIGLKESLLADGCRDALVVWQNNGNKILLDGHNRLTICRQYNLPYTTVEINLPDRDAARLWIIMNQLARRNLTDEQWTYFIGVRYTTEKKLDGGTGANQYTKGQGHHFDDPAKTKEKLATEYNRGEATVERAAKYAQSVDAIAAHSPELKDAILSGETGATKQDIVQLAAVLRDEPEVGKAAINELIAGNTKNFKQSIAVARPHIANNSGENEWYTPLYLIDAARETMGSIDCDPASSEVANKIIKAHVYYTANDNGLLQSWNGNVWLNPPYAQPLITEFATTLCNKFENGEIYQACVLVNNATETIWFQELLEKASVVCFLKTRVKFIDIHGNATGAPLQGQAILLISNDKKTIDRFLTNFDQYGITLTHATRSYS